METHNESAVTFIGRSLKVIWIMNGWVSEYMNEWVNILGMREQNPQGK